MMMMMMMMMISFNCLADKLNTFDLVILFAQIQDELDMFTHQLRASEDSRTLCKYSLVVA